MFNPFYLLVPPMLICVSIPLAVFAALTTSFAFSTLLVRVSIVYFELGVALLHSWLFTDTSKTAVAYRRSSPPSPTRSNPSHYKHRRTSAASTASPQEISVPRKVATKSDSFVSLVGAPDRDFEGVGGWRVFGDGDEEALWIGMNSRLELPAAVPERQRRHQRSLTSGSQRWSWSPEAIRMSPVQSRTRTPSVGEGTASPVEYFNFQMHGRRGGSMEGMNRMGDDDRRKSMSGSSISSFSSGKVSRTTVKQVSYG